MCCQDFVDNVSQEAYVARIRQSCTEYILNPIADRAAAMYAAFRVSIDQLKASSLSITRELPVNLWERNNANYVLRQIR